MEPRRQSIFSPERAKSMARKRDSYDEEHQKQLAQLETTRLEKIQASRERRTSRRNRLSNIDEAHPPTVNLQSPRANRKAGNRFSTMGRPPPMPARQAARPISTEDGEVPRKQPSRERRSSKRKTIRTSIMGRTPPMAARQTARPMSTINDEALSPRQQSSRERRSSRRNTIRPSTMGRPPPMPARQASKPMSPSKTEELSPRKLIKTERRESTKETPNRPSVRRRTITITSPDEKYKEMSEYRANLPRRLTGGSPPKNPRLGSKPVPPVEIKRHKKRRSEATPGAGSVPRRTSTLKEDKTKRKVAKKIQGTSPRKAAMAASTKSASTKPKPVTYGVKKKKSKRPKTQVKEKPTEVEEEHKQESEEEGGDDEEVEEDDDEEEEDEEEVEEEVRAKEKEVVVEEKDIPDEMEENEIEEADCLHSEWESIDSIEAEEIRSSSKTLHHL